MATTLGTAALELEEDELLEPLETTLVTMGVDIEELEALELEEDNDLLEVELELLLVDKSILNIK